VDCNCETFQLACSVECVNTHTYYTVSIVYTQETISPVWFSPTVWAAESVYKLHCINSVQRAG